MSLGVSPIRLPSATRVNVLVPLFSDCSVGIAESDNEETTADRIRQSVLSTMVRLAASDYGEERENRSVPCDNQAADDL